MTSNFVIKTVKDENHVDLAYTFKYKDELVLENFEILCILSQVRN